MSHLNGNAEKVENAGGGTHDMLRLKLTLPIAGNRLKEISLLWRTIADNKGGHYAAHNIPPEAWRETGEGESFEYEWTGLDSSTTYQVGMKTVQKRTDTTYETPQDKMTGVKTNPNEAPPIKACWQKEQWWMRRRQERGRRRRQEERGQARSRGSRNDG